MRGERVEGTQLEWCKYDAKAESLKWKSINVRKTKKKLAMDNISNRTIEICECWNSGMYSSTNIGKVVNLSPRNVIRHLQDGAKLGLCDY